MKPLLARQLHELGEDGLLRALAELLERESSGLVLPTGDDVAVSEPPAGRIAWTIDTMVEGTHFRWWPEQTGRLLGRKLAAVNLSDLAAKGATPLYALLSFGAPAGASAPAVLEFFESLAATLHDAGARLIGGDIVRAPQWTLTLSLAGVLDATAPVAARSAAQPGWNLYVTGAPGEAAAGLDLLEHHSAAERRRFPEVLARHLDPTARLVEGRALLGAFAGRLATIDVSDGIAHEAHEIAFRSGLRVVLEEAALEPSAALVEAARAVNQEPLDLMLYGGEDYEILFATDATPEAVAAALAQAGSAAGARHIGRTEPGAGVFLEDRSGMARPIGRAAFEHFAAPDSAP